MADEIVTNTETTDTKNSEATETSTTEAKATEEKSSATTEEKIDLAKGEGDKTTETKEAEVDARYGAPAEGEDYAIEIKGQTLDKEAITLASPVLRELNLSNEGATKLVSTFAEKVLPHYEQQFQNNLEATITTQRTEWEGAARDLIAGKDAAGEALVAKNVAGEVLGFDGNDMKGVQKVCARALDRYFPAGFRQFLDDTGIGVHPQMIAGIYQVGKMAGEDKDFETTGTTPSVPSRVDKYYPKS